MAIRIPRLRQNGAQAAKLEVADPGAGALVRVSLYDADGTDGQIDINEVRLDELHERRLLWIDISDLGQVETVATSLGIAPRHRREDDARTQAR